MPRPSKSIPAHRTKAEMERFRAGLHEHLLAGGQPKGFAEKNGTNVATGWLYRVAHAMGWSSFYITSEEKARILAERRIRAAGSIGRAA